MAMCSFSIDIKNERIAQRSEWQFCGAGKTLDAPVLVVYITTTL